MKQADKDVTATPRPDWSDAQPVQMPTSKADRARLLHLLADDDAVTLTYSQASLVRKALTVGLSALAEIERQQESIDPGPVLHPTGDPATFSEFADALMFVECDFRPLGQNRASGGAP